MYRRPTLSGGFRTSVRVSECRWPRCFLGMVVVAAALSVLDVVADVVCRHNGRGGVAWGRHALNDHSLRPSLAAVRRSWCSAASLLLADGVEESSPGVTWAEERQRRRSRDALRAATRNSAPARCLQAWCERNEC
jgi:hypothetical protein